MTTSISPKDIEQYVNELNEARQAFNKLLARVGIPQPHLIDRQYQSLKVQSNYLTWDWIIFDFWKYRTRNVDLIQEGSIQVSYTRSHDFIYFHVDLPKVDFLGPIKYSRKIMRSVMQFFYTHDVITVEDVMQIIQTVNSPVKEDFAKIAQDYGLQPDDLGAEFVVCNETYKVIGLNPRARLHKLLVQNKETGKERSWPLYMFTGIMGHVGKIKRKKEKMNG